MNAYVCDREHIAYLVKAAEWVGRQENYDFSWYHNGQHHKLDYLPAVGQMLWEENIKSVSYRYEDSQQENLPGPVGEEYKLSNADFSLELSRWHFNRNSVDCGFRLAQIFKAANCYSYQSCQHPEWGESEAKAFISALKGRAIHCLPGYDEAEWGAPKTPAPTVTPPPAPKPLPEPAPVATNGGEEDYSRKTTIERIRKALKARSGKNWSVTGGTGTAWGWITIDAPPARRKFDWEGTTPTEDGYMSLADREELGKLLGFDKPIHPQGESIAASNAYYRRYVELAETGKSETKTDPYWD